MRARAGLLGSIGALVALAAVLLSVGRADSAAPRPSSATVAAGAAAQDTAAIRRLMWQKVARAERAMRGLAVGDLDDVQKAADELVQIAAEAGWSVDRRTGPFAVYEAEFQRRAARLAQFAREGDLHGSYYQFVQVMLTCFDCHEELRPRRRR